MVGQASPLSSKLVFMKLPCLFLLCLAASGPAVKAEASRVAMAELVCNAKTSSFALKYIDANDDFFSEPNLPMRCQLGNTNYQVIGQRGAFSEGGMCGAQPPVSISIFRNGQPLVVGTVFGDNCFHGPAISSIEIIEADGKLKAFRFCIFKEPQGNPVCKKRSVNGHQGRGIKPVQQSTLNDLISSDDR